MYLKEKFRSKIRPFYYALVRRPMRKIQQIFGPNDFVPSGHFYSPIPSKNDALQSIKNRKLNPNEILGIDLCVDSQLALLEEFKSYYPQMPFDLEGKNGLRYYLWNGYYAFGDGAVLYSMLRKLMPKRIIEVGSGFTSALMHDVNEIFFASKESNKGGGKNTNNTY